MLYQLRKTIGLAIPVILGQLGQMILGFTDSIMVGRLGSLELATSSFVLNVFTVGLVCFIGITTGISVRVSQSLGAGKKENCGQYLINGLLVSFVAVVVVMSLLFSLTPFLHLFGQVPIIAQTAKPFYLIIVWSMLPLFLFFSYKQFLDGLQSTKPAMVATFAGIAFNFIFNYLFIFGHGGFPRMGLFGAGLSTLISRVLMSVGLVIYVHQDQFCAPFLHYFSFSFSRVKVIDILKIGIPCAFQYLFEAGAFSGAGILVGWISVEALAAHQIVITLVSTTFMIALGMSLASSVRIGEAFGARDYENVRVIAKGSILFIFVFEIFSCALCLSCRFALPRVFTIDPQVIHTAALLLSIGGIFQIFDGTQSVVAGLLRGISDVKIPTVVTFFSYWVVGLPLAYFLAFKLSWGAQGVWWGLALSLMAASSLLIFRFAIRTRNFKELQI